MGKVNLFIKKWMERLNPEPRVAGLAIANEDIRYVFAGKKGEEKSFVQIPEGTLEQGTVKNPEGLESALLRLHDTIMPKKKNEVIKVVVAFPPGAVYVQSLKIPYVGENQLEESVRLNLEMVTPIRAEDAYMGWQKVKELDNEIELLGAFMEKTRVENMRGPLERAKFYPVAFEFPAVSLLRMFKIKEEEGINMFAHISNDGMDFFITKDGSLYFDYVTSWKEIQGEAKEVSGELFDEALEREVRKVSNFAISKAGKGLDRAIYVAEGLEARVEAVLRGKLGLKTERAEIEGATSGPLWYTAEGAARRRDNKNEKHRLNIGGEGLKKAFFEERLTAFIRLWRGVGVMVLILFLIMDGWIATFLGKQKTEIQEQIAGLTTREKGEELVLLEDKVKEFNALVRMVGKEREGQKNWPAFLSNMEKILKGGNIRLKRLEVDGKTGLVVLSAEGGSHNAVIDLKNTLSKERGIQDVDLPLSKIAVTDSNNVTFSLSFKIKNE